MIGLKRSGAAALGVMLALGLAVAILTLILDGMGSSAGLMQSTMETHAPTAATGLPAEQYAPVAQMIAGYLSGKTDEFQYTFTREDGSENVCFNTVEQTHMADCRALFVLDRKVLLIALAVCCFSAAGLTALRTEKRLALRGFLAGIGGIILMAAALLMWGLIDFDSLFVLFHRLSFTNNLWLLNPETDLLIRLMPTSFFISCAALAGGTWLGILCLLQGIGQALLHRWKKRAGEPHEGAEE